VTVSEKDVLAWGGRTWGAGEQQGEKNLKKIGEGQGVKIKGEKKVHRSQYKLGGNDRGLAKGKTTSEKPSMSYY